MGAGTVALLVALVPLVPVLAFSLDSGAMGAVAILVLLVVQDGAYLGTALFFASLRRARPRAWHFGLRATPARRTVLIAVGVTLAVFAFELGYIELLGVDEGNADDLTGGPGFFSALAVSLAVIVVAPVTEEIFFRGFFYRALRNRMRARWAAPLNGLIFGSLHYSGVNTVETLPVIMVFGLAVCLVYEHTGSIFACISVHAAFNTLATVGTDPGYAVPIAVGLCVFAGCLLVPRRLGPAPSAFAGHA
jgi:membrane protease YdiL (CAAX protease family)